MCACVCVCVSVERGVRRAECVGVWSVGLCGAFECASTTEERRCAVRAAGGERREAEVNMELACREHAALGTNDERRTKA